MYPIRFINDNQTTDIQTTLGVPVIRLKKLQLPGIIHGFSTRLGGVSTGIYEKMNLSFQRGDDAGNVMENHIRFANAVGYDYTRLVFSDQVHETRIRKVTEEDAGKGITRESDICETDGLMTNVKNLPLMTFYADCVPILFYDAVKRSRCDESFRLAWNRKKYQQPYDISNGARIWLKAFGYHLRNWSVYLYELL